MLGRILITLGTLIFGLVVPLMEINGSHVFNPAWTPHARLHEVWQLATNSSLALCCLWLAWVRRDLRLSAILALCVTGGFLFAYTIRGAYDGSMVHSDGSESTLMGLSIGVVGFGLVILLSALALLLERPRRLPA